MKYLVFFFSLMMFVSCSDDIGLIDSEVQSRSVISLEVLYVDGVVGFGDPIAAGLVLLDVSDDLGIDVYGVSSSTGVPTEVVVLVGCVASCMREDQHGGPIGDHWESVEDRNRSLLACAERCT